MIFHAQFVHQIDPIYKGMSLTIDIKKQHRLPEQELFRIFCITKYRTETAIHQIIYHEFQMYVCLRT